MDPKNKEYLEEQDEELFLEDPEGDEFLLGDAEFPTPFPYGEDDDDDE